MTNDQPSWWRIATAVFVGSVAAAFTVQAVDAFIAHEQLNAALYDLQQQRKAAERTLEDQQQALRQQLADQQAAQRRAEQAASDAQPPNSGAGNEHQR